MTPELKELNLFGGFMNVYSHYVSHHSLPPDVAQGLQVISRFVTKQRLYDQVKAEIRYLTTTHILRFCLLSYFVSDEKDQLSSKDLFYYICWLKRKYNKIF